MYLSTVLDAITEADLQSLKENQVSEGKLIEYKQCLPGNDDKSKKEFLADITSFANAAGGHLIFGIQEEDGIPKDLCGLNDINPDAEILRLENMIRDSVEPRIHGLAIRPISLENAGTIIVMYIPNSWSKPHVVNFQKHWRFYSRNSAGKYQLDGGELRTTFTLSDTIWNRIRDFRLERLASIAAGETPVPLEGISTLVLHIVPLSISDPTTRLDLSTQTRKLQDVRPIRSAGWNSRHNYDGFLTYSSGTRESLARTYVQMFRSGAFEAVETTMLSIKTENNETPLIPSLIFEQEIIAAVSLYLRTQEQIGVLPPVLIMLSLLGVRGYGMAANPYQYPRKSQPIDRKDLILPDIMLQEFGNHPDQIMRPAFDAIWNAAGWPRSMNYDEDGKWNPQRS